MNTSQITLALQSETRVKLVKISGFNFKIQPAFFDKETYILENMNARSVQEIAQGLAAEKSLNISRKLQNCYVLGGDSILSFKDNIIQKCKNITEAKQLLQKMRGKMHFLHSAICVSYNHEIVFQAVDTAMLEFFNFSDEFIDDYLREFGDKILSSVGCVRIEVEGVRMFSKTNGDYFTIMGLSLLPLINFFRKNKLIEA